MVEDVGVLASGMPLSSVIWAVAASAEGHPLAAAALEAVVVLVVASAAAVLEGVAPRAVGNCALLRYLNQISTKPYVFNMLI